jgi:hypothetical protein
MALLGDRLLELSDSRSKSHVCFEREARAGSRFAQTFNQLK